MREHKQASVQPLERPSAHRQCHRASRDGDNLHLLFVAGVGYQLTLFRYTELECVTERWKIDSCIEDTVHTADSPLGAQRMRGERCRAWTELWMQTESSLLLGSWSPALCCKGCHGDGFNYAASLIAKCSAGKPYKLFRLDSQSSAKGACKCLIFIVTEYIRSLKQVV